MVIIQRESRIDDEGDTRDNQKVAVLGKVMAWDPKDMLRAFVRRKDTFIHGNGIIQKKHRHDSKFGCGNMRMLLSDGF